MLGLFDINNVDSFSRYILAGFIIYIVRNAYIVGERPAIAEITLDIVLLSTINQIIWWGVSVIALELQAAAVAASSNPSHFADIAVTEQTALVIETLVLPTALGAVLGIGLRAGYFRGFTRFIALPSTSPTKRAYDAVFTEIKDPTYVIVTLEDGTQVHGLFGDKSHAGRDPDRSELFLEEMFALDASENWASFDPPRSTMIRLSKLKAIEFLNHP